MQDDDSIKTSVTLPRALHVAFKTAAAARQKRIQAAVEEALARWTYQDSSEVSTISHKKNESKTNATLNGSESREIRGKVGNASGVGPIDSPGRSSDHELLDEIHDSGDHAII